ncbi:MAG: biotin/lipoyl-binding protein [Deltaproteobacteria bacterium]|nr:biotin/lipoyl-binding protein [Deltaproteobacteria bacterium]
MFRKNLIRVLLVLVLCAFVGAGVWYWLHIKTFVSTDDAYVYGYVGVISARVPGRVAKVSVDDNQFVKPGQVLLTLEPQDFESALAQAEGNLGRLRQDLAQNYVKVSTSRAKLTEAEANFKLAGTDKVRYTALYEHRTVPKQTLENAAPFPSRIWTTSRPVTG